MDGEVNLSAFVVVLIVPGREGLSRTNMRARSHISFWEFTHGGSPPVDQKEVVGRKTTAYSLLVKD